MRCQDKRAATGGNGRHGSCRPLPPLPPCAAPPLSFSSLYQEPHRVPKNTLSVTDNRTGKQYELPIESGTIRAVDLRQIKLAEGDQGLETYDPGFLNTAACRSAISFIDGDKGILRYRGYPIEQLAERSTFLETAYLPLHGELPSAAELDSWVFNVTHHTIVHESIRSEEHTSELQSRRDLVCRLL